MTDPALGISGRIGSGKTSLASVLAERLGYPKASFGDYVRSVAETRGLDVNSRSVLQDLGDELIAEGWDRFCHAVLAHEKYVGGPIVVDGIRHLEAAETMRDLVAPTPWRLIAVDSEDDVRLGRLADLGVDPVTAHHADSHPNEAQVVDVMSTADFFVSADSGASDAADAVIAWIATQ